MDSSKPDTVQLGAREFTLSPLSFGALKVQRENIRRMALGEFEGSDDLFAAMAEIVHASIVRRHTGVTVAEIEAELDWPVAHATVERVLVMSFPQAPPGEPLAESPSGSSTGTPASPT